MILRPSQSNRAVMRLKAQSPHDRLDDKTTRQTFPSVAALELDPATDPAQSWAGRVFVTI